LMTFNRPETTVYHVESTFVGIGRYRILLKQPSTPLSAFEHTRCLGLTPYLQLSNPRLKSPIVLKKHKSSSSISTYIHLYPSISIYIHLFPCPSLVFLRVVMYSTTPYRLMTKHGSFFGFFWCIWFGRSCWIIENPKKPKRA